MVFLPEVLLPRTVLRQMEAQAESTHRRNAFFRKCSKLVDASSRNSKLRNVRPIREG